MILSVLGVDRETIINEYLMTNYYTVDQLSNNLDKIREMTGGKINEDALIPLMTVDRSYIEAAFKVIDDKYKTMDDFIRSGLNISDAQRKAYMKEYTY